MRKLSLNRTTVSVHTGRLLGQLWPLDRFPPIEIGIMTLNENVQNAFAEDEQLALNPANLVSGIEPSPDRLLLGRLFAYLDTQFYRSVWMNSI